MEYTKNYKLPQWVETDRVLMDDFNNAMTNIEEGMSTAQDTASTAKELASAAQETATTALNTLPYVIGSYVGTDADKTITVGFRPRMVIINGLTEYYDALSHSDFGSYSAIKGETTITNNIVFTATGFTVKGEDTTDYNFPKLSKKSRKYDYIAFK